MSEYFQIRETGTQEIRLKCEMRVPEAIEVSQQSGRVYILEFLSYDPSTLTCEIILYPGNGMAEVQRVESLPKTD